MGSRVHLVIKVLRANPGHQGLLELTVLQGPRVREGQLDHRVTLVLQVPRVFKGLWVIRAAQVNQGHKDNQEPLEQMDSRDYRGHQDRRVNQVPLVLQDLKDL